MDPDKTFVDWAVSILHGFDADMDRGQAAVVLAMWTRMRKLREKSPTVADELTGLVLAHFSPAEPPNVPGRDWLPSAAEVASYRAAVAESLDAPAPVKAV